MTYFLALESNDRAAKLHIQEAGNTLTFREVFERWRVDSAFADFYAAGLIEQIGDAFFWEHPPLVAELLDEQYEVVLHEASSFEDRQPNEQAFAAHFAADQAVAVFDNLGKNARLIVPAKIGTSEIYKHLGVFLANADKAQVRSLLQETGRQVLKSLENGQRIWLNTSGLGVIWLHVRLDTRPKYYKTKAYKNTDYFVI